MFSLNKKSAQIWLLRLGAFALTASSGFVLSDFLTPSRTHTVTVEHSAVVILAKSESPIVSFPKIDFPVPLSQLDSSNFYIELSAFLDSDGKVAHVESNPGFAITFVERSYVDTVVPKIGTWRALQLRQELVQLLKEQIEDVKFNPVLHERGSNNEIVAITVHFKSITAPSGSGFRCAQMKTSVTAFGGVWTGITSTDRYPACSDI